MQPKFTADDIWTLYERNVATAGRKLKALPVYCGGDPSFRGLSGWVFEQVVHHCLRKELRGAGVKEAIAEQFTVDSRAKADLKIGTVLVEIKQSGVFSREAYAKYARYRQAAEQKGFTYVFFSGEETYRPNRVKARATFGPRNTFYLDSSADWARFVGRIVAVLKGGSAAPRGVTPRIESGA